MKKGFTLIELVLTIVIVGIIAGVSGQVLLRGIDSYALVMNRKDALQHARVGMDRMMYELMVAKTADFTSISDTKISFRDMGGNLTNFQRSTVQGTYELYRSGDFLSGRVGLLDFDFYKSNDSQAFWPFDVRRINIELTIQTLGGYGSIPLRTEVFPRNFMYTDFH